MSVGSFPRSDLIVCVINSKLIVLNSTANIEFGINVNNWIWSFGNWPFLFDKPRQNNFKKTWVILDHSEPCIYMTWTLSWNLTFRGDFYLTPITSDKWFNILRPQSVK